MVDTKRRAVLLISPQFIVDAVKQPANDLRACRVVAHALPADATVVAVAPVDVYRGIDMISVLIESREFPPVPLNERAPELPTPQLRIEYPDNPVQVREYNVTEATVKIERSSDGVHFAPIAPGTPEHEAAWRDLGRPADALEILDVSVTRGAFAELMAAAYRDVVDERSYIPKRIEQLTEALWRRLKGAGQ
jgi:hypothetical protein